MPVRLQRLPRARSGTTWTHRGDCFGYPGAMTPPNDPDPVDPTNQSGRPVIGLVVVGVLAVVLLVMVVVFMTTT